MMDDLGKLSAETGDPRPRRDCSSIRCFPSAPHLLASNLIIMAKSSSSRRKSKAASESSSEQEEECEFERGRETRPSVS